MFGQKDNDIGVSFKRAKKARRKARVEQRAIFRKGHYTPSISLGAGDAVAINFEYPFWKWNTLNVSFGKKPSSESAGSRENSIIESRIRVDEGVEVTKENLTNLKNFEYVPIPCNWCLFGHPNNQLGILELGEKVFIPITNTPVSLSVKSYLWQKPAQSVKFYVELGWTLAQIKGRDVTFDIQRVDLDGSSNSKWDYQVYEQVAYSPISTFWSSSPMANFGCRIQPGKNKRFMIDAKYIGVVPKYHGYVETEGGRYRQYDELERMRISLGWVF